MNETNDWHFLSYQSLDEVTPFPYEAEPWKSMVFKLTSIKLGELIHREQPVP